MATFALIHGGGDGGWYWHMVGAVLRQRGHDVPLALAEEAMSRERSESDAAYNSPWPLVAWPDVPTKFVVCTEDRFFPAALLRRVVAERLGIVPDQIATGHCVALSRAEQLGRLLDSYA